MLLTLLGPDVFAKEQRLRALNLDNPLKLTGDDGVQPWMAAIGQADLFGQSRPVVGESLLKGLSAADAKELAKTLATVDEGQTVVVLEMAPELPAKDELAQVLATGQVEKFPLPSQGQVVRWLEQEANRLKLNVSKPEMVELAERFGSNRLALQTELEKMALAVAAGKSVDIASAVGTDEPVEAFGLVEAWLQRRPDQAMRRASQLAQQRHSVQSLLGLLEWQVRLLYICLTAQRRGEDASKWAAALNFKPFAVSKTVKSMRNWQLTQVEQALSGLFELDLGIKSGKIEPEVGLELWLVESLVEKKAV